MSGGHGVAPQLCRQDYRGTSFIGIDLYTTDADQPCAALPADNDATVYIDDASAYEGIQGVRHRAVNLLKGEFAKDQSITNVIQSFRACCNAYTKERVTRVSIQRLKRCINEFCVRYSARNHYTAEPTRMVGMRPSYRELVG